MSGACRAVLKGLRMGVAEGTSKATVAAGLVGGRVGNKGAVGISLKIAGTTILLLNAHLAGK